MKSRKKGEKKFKTVTEYLDRLPQEKKTVLESVRKIILKNLPAGYQESINNGMITYEVPLKTLPNTYNEKPLLYAALAAQKNYFAIYLMNLYQNPQILDWFKNEFEKSGRKLDMGKSCVRFKKLDNLPLDIIGKTISMTSMNEFVDRYNKTKFNSLLA